VAETHRQNPQSLPAFAAASFKKTVPAGISSPAYQSVDVDSTESPTHPIRFPSQQPKGASVPDHIRIQDLAADEIAELLAMEGSDLTESQAADLRDFVTKVGGLQNAYSAVEMLSQLEAA